MISPQVVVFTSEDITKRKQAEEALRESENKFRDLAEKALVGIYVIQDRVFKYVNSCCAQIHGYEIEELIDKKNPYDMILPEDLPEVEKNRAQISGEKKSLHHEFRIVTKTGEIRYVETYGTITMYQGRPATIGTMLDITERKHVEEALRRSEEKYRDIFEKSVEGMFQSTFEGRFISVNPAFASMYGYESPEEMLTIITDIEKQLYVYPEERRRFTAALEQYGTIVGFEHQAFRKDGSKIWISINARIVRDPDRNILYYEGFTLDITKRKQAEAEKEKLQSDLRQSQKMEAIGTFVGGIAHDFNNMLSVMMGYGTLLQTGLTIDNPMRKYADLIVASSEKAASLTRGLLSFSRKQPINLKNIKLNDVIKGTKKLLKTLLTEDITLIEKLTQDETTIMGDSSQIDQILFNLATNSRDAMPKGGTLIIETKIMNLDSYILGYEKPGKYVMLSFSDTGIGMDNNTKDHIFDPFFTTKEVGKGTGLGLSTVYGIVKQHNGYISVYTEPNIGTTFHIYFPVITESIKEEKPVLQKFRKGHETILVAEDSDSVRQLIKTILSSNGYIIIEAVDGEDAIAKFKKIKNIDLLIIDTIMPKKNGRELYDEVIKINPRIKTLFTSGYTRDVVLDKGIEEKEFNFIPKPITPNELLQKVGEILDEK